MRIAVLIVLLLAACQSAPANPTALPSSPTASPEPTRAPAALAVEAYLTAKVAGDRDGVR
ncbi:MAG: ABC transporter substrate-binding protein, partial [Phototrophicales bacterium]